MQKITKKKLHKNNTKQKKRIKKLNPQDMAIGKLKEGV